MGRITETVRCMVRLADSAILEAAIRCSSAFSRLTDALKAKIKRETIEQAKRASGRSFASVVTRKRPSLNRARCLDQLMPLGHAAFQVKAWFKSWVFQVTVRTVPMARRWRF